MKLWRAQKKYEIWLYFDELPKETEVRTLKSVNPVSKASVVLLKTNKSISNVKKPSTDVSKLVTKTTKQEKVVFDKQTGSRDF